MIELWKRVELFYETHPTCVMMPLQQLWCRPQGSEDDKKERVNMVQFFQLLYVIYAEWTATPKLFAAVLARDAITRSTSAVQLNHWVRTPLKDKSSLDVSNAPAVGFTAIKPPSMLTSLTLLVKMP